MIIWRNEYQPPGPVDQVVRIDPPPGTIEITRVEERGGNYHVWFVPVPATPAEPKAH